MFNVKTYAQRRLQLAKKMKSGIVLIVGNSEAPMNYGGNTYHYRQDSTFLYYFGLDLADLFGVIDLDENKEIVFGNDFAIDDIVWMGPQPTVKNLASKVGVKNTASLNALSDYLADAIKKGRKIHFTPQYRQDNVMKLHKLLGIGPKRVNDYASMELIKAIVEQRELKTKEEVDEIEKAIEISFEMHTAAMRFTKHGMIEKEIAGFIEGLALSMGSGTSFPIIFSKHGETLHNHNYNNKLKDGDIVVHDSGAESFKHYASDITRTFPVSGKFTDKQKDIYNIVLNMQLAAIKMYKPGVTNKAAHLKAASVAVQGLKDLGIMKGSVADAVKNGAHALFFPHGLGHLIGLDVHDMENYGENNIGYNQKIVRSSQFGLAYLRLGKELKAGHVITVEPGCYFIPQLIDLWKAENKFVDYINYDKVNEYRDFGGVRIEDDVLITNNGCKVLGKPIPKTIEDVEEVASDKI